jgi:hypothetical protein
MAAHKFVVPDQSSARRAHRVRLIHPVSDSGGYYVGAFSRIELTHRAGRKERWAAGFALAIGWVGIHFRLMHSHELLREVFQKANPKQVSADLGLSLSMIYKWAEPTDEAAGSGTSNPLDRISALLQSTSDPRIAQWVCQKAGGFFIRNPQLHHAHPDFLIPATNEIIQEFADLLAVVAAAAADNHITPDESKKIRARWEELKTVTECFVHCCEEGNFRALKDRPPVVSTDSKD